MFIFYLYKHSDTEKPIGHIDLHEAPSHVNIGGRLFERYGFRGAYRYYEIEEVWELTSAATLY